MAKNPLKKLVIRSAAVRRPDLGYILAGDPKLEEQEVDHTFTFAWNAGNFNQARAQYSAHTCCLIAAPEFGLVKASGSGFYTVDTPNGVTTGNIFHDSQPKPRRARHGEIRSVCTIDSKAYAVGLEGMVYRLDRLSKWTRIDEDVSRKFDIEAADGFHADDLYAVGFLGEVWQLNQKTWWKHEMPTNLVLSAVKCAGDNMVYVGGHRGILLRGTDDAWEIIDHEVTEDDIWDLEWFQGKLYVSTFSGVYVLIGDELEPLEFGKDPPATTYQLSEGGGVMWSIGEHDIVSFDGKRWTRIV